MEVIIIQTFYFVFHQQHKNKTYMQQVVANNKTLAIYIINETYDDKTISDSPYRIISQAEYENLIKNNESLNVTPLPPLYTKKTLL